MGYLQSITSFSMVPEKVAGGVVPAVNLPEARRQFKLGGGYFADLQYEKALKAFQESYRLSLKPDLLFNIAQCHSKLGEYEKAIEMFERFLKADPHGGQADAVQGRIKALRQEIESQKRRSAEEAYIDSSATKALYEAGREYYQGGEYQKALDKFVELILLSENMRFQYDLALCHEKLDNKREAIEAYQLYLKEGNPTEVRREEVEARIAALQRPAGEPEITAEAEPEDPPSPPETIDVYVPSPSPSKSSSKKWMWASFGLSAIALAGGAGSYWLAHQRDKEHAEKVEDLVRQGRIEGSPGNYRYASEKAKQRHKPGLDRLREEMETYQNISLAALIGGAVFLGVGGVLFALDDEKKAKVSLQPQSDKIQLNFEYRF